jgi:hypothetical protein
MTFRTLTNGFRRSEWPSLPALCAENQIRDEEVLWTRLSYTRSILYAYVIRASYSGSLGEEICLARAAAPVIVISGIQIDGSRHSPIVCRRGCSSLCSYWSIE